MLMNILSMSKTVSQADKADPDSSEKNEVPLTENKLSEEGIKKTEQTD